MPKLVLAIDPGERVGWATGEIRDTPSGVEIVPRTRGVSPLKDFALKLATSYARYDIVIYETWRLYPSMGKKMIGNDMLPSQLIGMIRLISWMNPSVKLVSQGAQIKETALKTMPKHFHKWIQPSSEQHDKDAAMHLWYYYFKEYK